MNFFKSKTPPPAEVSRQTVQFCIYAVIAVAIADILTCLTQLGHMVIDRGRYAFTIDGIKLGFWIVAEFAPLVLCATLFAYLIHKRFRDAVAGAAGFCLCQIAIYVVALLRAGIDLAHNPLPVFGYVLLTGISAVALVALAGLLQRWPAKPPA